MNASCLVTPTAVPATEGLSITPRPETPDGSVLGVLVNGKEYSEAVLARIVERLREQYEFREVLWWDKHFPAQPAPQHYLDEMKAQCDLVLTGVGHCGASTTRSTLDAIALEERGVPTVLVLSSTFTPVGRSIADQRGASALSIATVPHPLGNPDPDVVEAKADTALDAVRVGLTRTPSVECAVAVKEGMGASAISAPADPGAAFDALYDAGWTDGLPVVPPMRELVDAMVASSGRDPDEVVAVIPPLQGKATVRVIAANAVMAGCRPEYLPVVLAAVDAVSDEKYGLVHRQITTHAGAPLIIVNGPIVSRLGLNSGTGVFGSGWRANATIGRALRLVLQNVGGAVPGITDMSQHGHPGKYTYCIAEDEQANPWEPLHVERGFAADQSVVTVMNAEAPHSATDNVTASARQTLTTCASVFATLGSNNLYSQGEPILALGPEHAANIAAEGWSKSDVKMYIFEVARQPWRLVRGRGKSIGPNFPKWLENADDDDMIPVVTAPEDLIVVVCGGAGGKSMVIPTAGAQSLSVSRAIQE